MNNQETTTDNPAPSSEPSTSEPSAAALRAGKQIKQHMDWYRLDMIESFTPADIARIIEAETGIGEIIVFLKEIAEFLPHGSPVEIRQRAKELLDRAGVAPTAE